MDGFSRAVEKIGQRIRQIRLERGLTQKDLAEKAGIFDVGELERGRKVKGGVVNPRLETLFKIAAALGIELDELLGYPAPDETTVRISRLLEGQDSEVKEKAVRVVEVLVKG